MVEVVGVALVTTASINVVTENIVLVVVGVTDVRFGGVLILLGGSFGLFPPLVEFLRGGITGLKFFLKVRFGFFDSAVSTRKTDSTCDQGVPNPLQEGWFHFDVRYNRRFQTGVGCVTLKGARLQKKQLTASSFEC